MKTVAFTGHRPNVLCGYDAAAYAQFVHDLAGFLAGLYPEAPLRVITGGAQGVDQLAFWAADLAKNRRPGITNVVYVPFRGQQSIWRDTGLFSRTEYDKMLKAADEVYYLAEKPADKSGIVRALHARNHRMVNAADEVIAVYKGANYHAESGGTAECMRYVESQNKPLRIIRCRVEDGRLAADFA